MTEQQLIDTEPDGAAVILYRDEMTLLQKRDSRPQFFPYYWAVFGGGIRQGETPEEAACRELKEELGYEISRDDLEPLGRFRRVVGPTYRPIVHYFRARLNRDLPDILLGMGRADNVEPEGNGIALFSHEEVDSLRLRCQDRVALERHFQGRDFGFID